MEIERKYLVDNEKWQGTFEPADGSFMQQTYLSNGPGCAVRVRVTEKSAFITIKGETKGISREEFEYPIPFEDGMQLLRLAGNPIVAKRRYELEFEGYVWQVDEFLDDNEGLILAEVELRSEQEVPECPGWVDREVSGDPRYFNQQLAINPIKNWK